MDLHPRLVLLGRQGSGKGTQVARLAGRYGAVHVGTGDMLRAAARAETDLGRRVKGHLEAGELVPDEVVSEAVTRRLEEPDVRQGGFVLEGFPRTVGQAEVMGDVDAAVELAVPAEAVIARLEERRVCESCGATYSLSSPPRRDWTCDVCGGRVVQRHDDDPETVRHRLEVYERDTTPVLDWFAERDLLVRVDGMGPPDVVAERLATAVASKLGGEGHAPAS